MKFAALYGSNQNQVGYSDMVMAAIRNRPTAIGLVNDDPELGLQKRDFIAWFDRQVTPQFTTLTAPALVGDGSLTVASSAGFAVNDVIHPEQSGSNELLLVTAIPNGTTLTVTRGYRGTTATAISNATVVKLVEKETPEGFTPQTFTSPADAARTNYFQTFSRKYGITAESFHSNTWGVGELDRKMADERVLAALAMTNTLAQQFYYGVGQQGSQTQAGAFHGVRKMIATADAANVVNLGGQLTETALNDAIDALVAKGGDPNTVLVHPSRLQTLTSAAANRQQTLRSEEVLGAKVTVFQSRSYGEVGIIRDQALDPSDVVLLDWTKLGWSYREQWTDEDGFNQTNAYDRKLRAQISLVLRNAAASGYWLTGVTA